MYCKKCPREVQCEVQYEVILNLQQKFFYTHQQQGIAQRETNHQINFYI